MASNLIPAVGTKGRYVLKEPFAAAMKADTLYTLASVREFEEIDTFGTNILNLFYTPFGLTESDLNADRTAGAMLITLMSSDSQALYVPTSYVQSYPDLSYKPYNQYIATLSLGPLPSDTLFDSTIQALKNTVSDFLGVTDTVVNIAYMPLSDVITPEQNENREAARQAAINNRTTDYARLAEEQAKNALLQQRITILEQIVKDNGLLG